LDKYILIVLCPLHIIALNSSQLILGQLKWALINGKLFLCLERHGLIRESQHGLVRGRSCLTKLIYCFFKVVMKVIEEGRAVHVVYMDFSKACGKVPHGRFIEHSRVQALHNTHSAKEIGFFQFFMLLSPFTMSQYLECTQIRLAGR